MLIDGPKFYGSTSYVDKHNAFRSVAGNASSFTEFIPIHFPSIRTFHKLLFHFHSHGLCSFMTGRFVSYIAGFLTFFRGVSVYMILDDDHPIIHLIYQKGPNVIQHFIIGFFHFELLQRHRDSCIYRVRLGNFNVIMYFVSMQTRVVTSAQTSISYILFGIILSGTLRKFAITILPSDNIHAPLNLSSALPSNTKLLYLKYYTALSDDLCLDKRNCNQCMV